MATFTVADFDRLGRRNGFRYCLPRLARPPEDPAALCVAEGRVEEHAIRPGLTLVISDVVARQHYEATSLMTPRLSAIVMLQGLAQAHVERHASVQLAAHGGIGALYGDTVAMTGVHPAGQRLRSVNLSLCDPADAGDERISELTARVLGAPGLRLRQWPVPTHLVHAIEHLLASTWQGSLQQLLREGVALQLLAHALAALDAEPPPRKPALSPRDRQLLERVRERLHDAPGEDHTLEALARLACMSPSTLRAKFHAAYHCSVFHWLRERRLQVARERLAQGWTVQQAAHFVGYRHATNFATAFRERYGVAPSQLAG